MSLYINQIKKKIKNKIKLDKIEIIDNSYAQRGHKSFQKCTLMALKDSKLKGY